MRFLFTFCGGIGHFVPTEPFARALRERGHSVTYACQDAMLPLVESRGWPAQASGGATLLAADQRRPLAALDRAAEKDVIRTFFAGNVARERAMYLTRVIEIVRPDIVVRDEIDFGAAVAAEACGLPHAAVIVIAAGGFYGPELTEPLARLRSEYGLGSDGLAMLHRYLTLVPVPPSFRDPDDPLPATAHHLRPAVLDDRGTRDRSRRPGTTIYFTLGTVFHQESGDLFARVLAGLSDLDAQIVVSVGRELDPVELGPQPPNVRVERFVDAAQMLSRCDLVVSHGGSGTVVGALAFGVPQVLLPMGADQPLNADRCQALSLGIGLDAISTSAAQIRDTARTILRDRSCHARVALVRDEIHSLPPSADGATLLEHLVQDEAQPVRD